MGKRMSEDIWESNLDISKEIMDRRLRNCISNFLSWQHTIRLILERRVSFNTLKIAEVGCGSGTLSLTFAIMGASVTLLDYNQRVLEKAKEIYKLYGCSSEIVKADCMETPIADLIGKFDLVISSGLAEHFIGVDREKCIEYHRHLLKKDGFACIGVPNKFSPFYQWIRLFKKLTGTWELEIEVPFSPGELKCIAKKVGFRKAYVIGNMTLMRDLKDYTLGFGSAVKQLLPNILKAKLKALKNEERKGKSYSDHDIKRYLNDMAEMKKRNISKSSSSLVNNLSAGIYLFAFN